MRITIAHSCHISATTARTTFPSRLSGTHVHECDLTMCASPPAPPPPGRPSRPGRWRKTLQLRWDEPDFALG